MHKPSKALDHAVRFWDVQIKIFSSPVCFDCRNPWESFSSGVVVAYCQSSGLRPIRSSSPRASRRYFPANPRSPLPSPRLGRPNCRFRWAVPSRAPREQMSHSSDPSLRRRSWAWPLTLGGVLNCRGVARHTSRREVCVLVKRRR